VSHVPPQLSGAPPHLLAQLGVHEQLPPLQVFGALQGWLPLQQISPVPPHLVQIPPEHVYPTVAHSLGASQQDCPAAPHAVQVPPVHFVPMGQSELQVPVPPHPSGTFPHLLLQFGVQQAETSNLQFAAQPSVPPVNPMFRLAHVAPPLLLPSHSSSGGSITPFGHVAGGLQAFNEALQPWAPHESASSCWFWQESKKKRLAPTHFLDAWFMQHMDVS
jgi:hypothetical protein